MGLHRKKWLFHLRPRWMAYPCPCGRERVEPLRRWMLWRWHLPLGRWPLGIWDMIHGSVFGPCSVDCFCSQNSPVWANDDWCLNVMDCDCNGYLTFLKVRKKVEDSGWVIWVDPKLKSGREGLCCGLMISSSIIWGWVKTVGDGSKPWYLVNPKIAGKWMFIPLKMYL